MKSLRLFLFVFVFTVDVRVLAKTVQIPEARDLLQEPAGCLKSAPMATESCAVGTRAWEKGTLSFGDSTVVLDRSTAILLLGANEIRLVSGQIWLKSKSVFEVRTEFGSMKVEPGEYWFDRDRERVRVGVIQGTARLYPRGAQDVLEVTPGLENWLGKVDASGEAQRGIPVVIQFKPHLQRWARLYAGTLKDFEKDVRDFHEVWLAASEYASEIHKALFERKVASLRAEHEKLEAARRRTEARTRELLRMFREKVFGP